MSGKMLIVGGRKWKAQNGVDRARLLVLVRAAVDGNLGYEVIEVDAAPASLASLTDLPGIYEYQADIFPAFGQRGPRLYVKSLHLLFSLEPVGLEEEIR